jgi:hypothetical protein
VLPPLTTTLAVPLFDEHDELVVDTELVNPPDEVIVAVCTKEQEGG